MSSRHLTGCPVGQLTGHLAGQPVGCLAGHLAGVWQGGRVHERIIIRVSGRQRGSAICGSVRVHGRVIVRTSGQAAEAVRISKTYFG